MEACRWAFLREGPGVLQVEEARRALADLERQATKEALDQIPQVWPLGCCKQFSRPVLWDSRSFFWAHHICINSEHLWKNNQEPLQECSRLLWGVFTPVSRPAEKLLRTFKT